MALHGFSSSKFRVSRLPYNPKHETRNAKLKKDYFHIFTLLDPVLIHLDTYHSVGLDQSENRAGLARQRGREDAAGFSFQGDPNVVLPADLRSNVALQRRSHASCETMEHFGAFAAQSTNQRRGE